MALRTEFSGPPMRGATGVDTPMTPVGPTHWLRFQSLFNGGKALSFPCDAAGRVDLDALSERARENYLYARAVVGREYSTPEVVPAALH